MSKHLKTAISYAQSNDHNSDDEINDYFRISDDENEKAVQELREREEERMSEVTAQELQQKLQQELRKREEEILSEVTAQELQQKFREREEEERLNIEAIIQMIDNGELRIEEVFNDLTPEAIFNISNNYEVAKDVEDKSSSRDALEYAEIKPKDIGLYHETQVQARCGLHAMNNAEEIKQAFTIESVAPLLERDERNRQCNNLDFGVIQRAVERHDNTRRRFDIWAPIEATRSESGSGYISVKIVDGKPFTTTTPSLRGFEHNDPNEFIKKIEEKGFVGPPQVGGLYKYRIIINLGNGHWTSAISDGNTVRYHDSMKKNILFFKTTTDLFTYLGRNRLFGIFVYTEGERYPIKVIDKTNVAEFFHKHAERKATQKFPSMVNKASEVAPKGTAPSLPAKRTAPALAAKETASSLKFPSIDKGKGKGGKRKTLKKQKKPRSRKIRNRRPKKNITSKSI
jgi:hypothetical protein